MHEIEPFFNWRDSYTAEEDERSPFYGRTYSEFEFSATIYNFYIHPQWDDFGSPTLYAKILYADYDKHFAIIEFIGEWNDCLNNDIMWIKRSLADRMMEEGIYKFVLIGENVLNFHLSDNCYYEEWQEEVSEYGGWIAALNFRPHVVEEMLCGDIHYYMQLGAGMEIAEWRIFKPSHLIEAIESKFVRNLPETSDFIE